MANHNIGSVSSGTMRAEDLIPSLLDELRRQKPLRREHRKLAREIAKRMDADYTHDHDAEGCKCNGLGLWDCGMNADAEDYFGSDDADYDLESLFDALNEYARLLVFTLVRIVATAVILAGGCRSLLQKTSTACVLTISRKYHAITSERFC